MTQAQVDAQIAQGARSVKAIRNGTGAGTSCGSCVKRISCQLAAAKTPEPGAIPEMWNAETPVPTPVREAPTESRWKSRLTHQPGCPSAVPALG